MTRLTLVVLVVLGLWSGGRLSYNQYQSGEACPILGGVPACYIAFVGYLMMALALGVTTAKPELKLAWMFWLGLLAAGGLALIGSGLEVVKGNICPRAFGWLPMCYLSLAMSITIGGLFWGTTKPRKEPL